MSPGKGGKTADFNQVELEKAAFYAAEDADITLRLHQTLWPQAEKEPALKALLLEMELPLAEVLSDMERTGAPHPDPFLLQNQSQQSASGRLDSSAGAWNRRWPI